MSMARRMTGSACLAALLTIANAAQAQSQAPTTAPAGAPVAPDAIFMRWDKDNDKTLSMDEFKTGWLEVQATMALRSLHESFVVRDTNKSGSLEAAEYANLELVRKAGKSAPPMSAFDSDKNQVLDFKEYVGLVKTLFEKQR